MIKPQSIPAKEIKIEDSEGQLFTMKLNTILFFKYSIMEEKSVLSSSSSTSVTVTEKKIIEKSKHFPTYNPRKRAYNREEQNSDPDILTSNVAETINITQIPAKSSPDTTESEIYSMKHLNKKHVLQNVKDDFDFRSKTANYINQVIPMEKRPDQKI